jgi:hypothetical protein
MIRTTSSVALGMLALLTSCDSSARRADSILRDWVMISDCQLSDGTLLRKGTSVVFVSDDYKTSTIQVEASGRRVNVPMGTAVIKQSQMGQAAISGT